MTTTRKWGGPAAALFLPLALGLAGGCSVRHGENAHASRPAAGEQATGDLTTAKDRARLDVVIAARAHEPADDGYRLGPDDLLDIRIPDLLEASAAAAAAPRTAPGSTEIPAVTGAPAFQQGIRVSADGHVNVPMLGAIPVTGLTTTGLEREIANRLIAGGILRKPQVNVLVAEYRSHVVAVIGSVERPGLYPVTRPGATLADLVWAAGGPNREAGRMIEFTP